MVKKKRGVFLAGNWKMYKLLGEAVETALALKPLVANANHCEVVIAPVFVQLKTVADRLEAPDPVEVPEGPAGEPHLDGAVLHQPVLRGEGLAQRPAGDLDGRAHPLTFPQVYLDPPAPGQKLGVRLHVRHERVHLAHAVRDHGRPLHVKHPAIFREPAPGLNRQSEGGLARGCQGGLVYCEVDPPACGPAQGARSAWAQQNDRTPPAAPSC